MGRKYGETMIINALRQGEIATALYILVSVLLALTVHEFAHGYVAYKCGDNTARYFGRLTFNPVKHIDLFGFLALLIAVFGWAKPVPVITRNLKKPRRDIALVSLAGPGSNFILAFIGTFLYSVMFTLLGYQTVGSFLFNVFYNFGLFFFYLAVINVGLCLFNLIPIPPLDGSKILASILPQKLGMRYLQLERYAGIFILAIFVLSSFSEFDFLFYPLAFLRDSILNGFEKLFGLLPFIN
jgi:Zn-dependent protease